MLFDPRLDTEPDRKDKESYTCPDQAEGYISQPKTQKID
jgi:hypothetical protein